MVRLSNDFLQRLKDSVNINDIIGSYVDLKKKGRYYFASCPFHGPEKTPSFSVSPEKGFYYCFGCHESGDVFHFLQKMEGITFMEAVERVAIDMPTEEISPEERQKAAMMKKMLEVTELAGSYFHNCLTRTQMGQAGMAYFEKRHLSMETIEKFKLGFAPADWHRLYHDFTTKKQIDPKILTACGLCGYKNGNYFDMFRNRCMFPILDLKGRVVAFGGRVMDDSKPKYLNSPETKIFDKSRNLYGLNIARTTRKPQLLLCEGYMDPRLFQQRIVISHMS